MDDAEGGERRIERWSESEGLDACENHRAGLFLGSSKTDACAEERVTASEALGLRRRWRTRRRLNVVQKRVIGQSGRGCECAFLYCATRCIRDRMDRTVGAAKRDAACLVQGAPTSFTVKDFGKNVTNLILTMDFTR